MAQKILEQAKVVSTSDFRMSFGTDKFHWFGEVQSGMPIIRWPDGRLCQPLIFYFGYLCRLNLEQASSMEPRAYMLREWFSFLACEGIPWYQADDFVMHRWRQRQTDDGISEEQREKKLRSVYHFYLHVPDAMQRLEDGSVTPDFVGRNKRSNLRRYPITTKRVRTRSGEPITVWSGSRAIKHSTPDLTVPDNDQCDRVLLELRSPSNSISSSQNSHIDPVIKRERDWAMGRLMVGAGLRADEVPELKLTDLTRALANEGIFKGLGRERARSIVSLAELANDSAAQDIVLKGLKHFEVQRRRLYIGVKIKGKGRKVRHAGFMIDLIYDLLTVVVWGGRAVLIKQWQTVDPTYEPEDTLFLSFKTSDALTAGAVSDIMLKAFKAADVAGSGHDLRKNYATNLAAKILSRNLDRFGYFTHAVLNTVLDEVATGLGHAKVTTTTKHYTNLAVVHSTGLESSRKRSRIMKIWEMLLQSKDMMDDERIQLCGTAMKVFAEVPKESQMYGMLSWAMTNPDYNPGGLIDLSPAPATHLRLVSDNGRLPK